MILPLQGHHIADVGDYRYSYPSTVVTYHLRRRNDLAFYGAGHLSPYKASRCYEIELFRKHIKPEPARPLFYWKNTYIFEEINNVDQMI